MGFLVVEIFFTSFISFLFFFFLYLIYSCSDVISDAMWKF